MADTAFQIQYRQEFVAAFEARSTLLRETVTTEAVIKGNQAIFLVAGSGTAVAVTRGVSGLIPARVDSLTQNTCTLQEWHDKVVKTGFNVFASQGNQRSIMQMTTMNVINRKIDDLIITQLNTGTVAIGSATTIPNISFVMNAQVKLSNASVPADSNITLLAQPSFMAYLEQAPEFASALFVNLRPFAGDEPNWRDQMPAYRWKNMLVISHPNLPGKGTSSEKSFIYHKSSMGYAMDTAGLQTSVGYDDQDDYSYSRASAYMGAVVLQNAGIVVATADGSAYA